MFDSYVTYWARQKPQALAITTLISNVTYQQFDRDIDRIAVALRPLGLSQSGLVGVQLANPYAHWLALMALSRLGIASASVPTGDASSADALSVMKPGLLLVDRPEDGIGTGQVATLTPDWIEKALRTSVDPLASARRDPDAIGRISTSSGTTGLPKAIPYTWRNMVERGRRRASLDLGGSDISLVTVGNDSILGFSHRLAAWIVGATVALGPEIRQLPPALSTLRPTSMALSPGHLHTLISALPHDFRPIPFLRVRVGGGALPAKLAREARLRLSADLDLIYASSEGGMIARGPAALLDIHPGAVGYKLPWAEIEAVDADGALCPPGITGELRVRSDEIVTGYHGDNAQTEASFRDGWFYPGDVGAIMADGEIRIEGRTDEVMNLGGLKLLPGAVENVIQSCSGVRDVAVFSTKTTDGIEAPWAAIVRSDQFDQDELASRLHKRLPTLPPLQIAWVDEVPRNGTGKVQRQVLRHLVSRAQENTGAHPAAIRDAG